jgi:hypothetical protein
MSSHEIDPVALARRNTPEKEALKEIEPSHQTKLEILYPHAFELVKAHRSKIVEKVEKVLSLRKSFEKFTENELKELARDYGSDEVEMIEAIAMALNGEKP